LRLEAYRTDQSAEVIRVGLARPGHDPARIRPLFALKMDTLDAGFGIDMLRLVAEQSEALHDRRAVGHLQAGRAVSDRLAESGALEDLVGRLGARFGLEEITRRHPGSSHIPEKTAQTLAAAWSGPAPDWPMPATPRPLLLWRPEPLHADESESQSPPARFRWRGRDRALAMARGPERIAPEWWFDDPDWRTGLRDYWVVTTGDGDRLWCYFAHGAAMSAGWFCHGSFL
jgi:protein ImuB